MAYANSVPSSLRELCVLAQYEPIILLCRLLAHPVAHVRPQGCTCFRSFSETLGTINVSILIGEIIRILRNSAELLPKGAQNQRLESVAMAAAKAELVHGSQHPARTRRLIYF